MNIVTIKRIWVEDTCIGCGMSEINCPEVFRIDDINYQSAVIENVDFSVHEDSIREVAAACPVDAIKFEES